MREYKILTDSTTDLSPQLVAQTGVTVLPKTNPASFKGPPTFFAAVVIT